MDKESIEDQGRKNLPRVERLLLKKLGLPELRSGAITIRDERGWRQDEISIDYIWIVCMNRSFIGCGGLVGIKFNEHTFRSKHHPEELLTAIFSEGPKGIDEYYEQRTLDTGSDSVVSQFRVDLFNANKGIALDGVSYNIHIIAPNIDTIIIANNPTTPDWKKWESEIWTVGKRLAIITQRQELIDLFTPNSWPNNRS